MALKALCWGKVCCALCTLPATGFWNCEFGTYSAVRPLCAACGLAGAFAKWAGYFGPKLHRIDLVATITLP